MAANVDDMSAELRAKFEKFVAEMEKRGLKYGERWRLQEVLRTKPLQAAYAAQGRTWAELKAMLVKAGWTQTLSFCEAQVKAGLGPKALCNALRERAGVAKLPASDWYKVTWTLNSKHFANAQGKSDAFDLVMLQPGKVPTWGIKWDGDKDSIPDYKEAAAVARLVGLYPGADFKTQDWPHVQLSK